MTILEGKFRKDKDIVKLEVYCYKQLVAFIFIYTNNVKSRWFQRSKNEFLKVIFIRKSKVLAGAVKFFEKAKDLKGYYVRQGQVIGNVEFLFLVYEDKKYFTIRPSSHAHIRWFVDMALGRD